MFSHRSGAPRSLLAALLVLLLVAAGCTGDVGRTASPGPEEVTLPDRSVGSSATLEPKPVPMQVRIGRTVGHRLPKRQEKKVARQVGRVLSDYFDGAFLGGGYPRAGYPRAFSRFTQGAKRSARKDRDLLTNSSVGRRIEGVHPRRKEARLDLLVPHLSVAGVTARIRLVFVTERAKGPGHRVVVTGRLLLSRAAKGPWRVFGYDVKRSATAVRRA